MGYARYFYAEEPVGDRWVSCHPNTSESSPDVPSKHIAWIAEKLGRAWVADLFNSRDIGPHDGLLAMSPGLPPDAQRSSICRRELLPHLSSLEESHPTFIEFDPHWISAADLMISEWTNTDLLVTRMAPAGLAELFGNGRAPFPSEYWDRLQGLLYLSDYWPMVDTFCRYPQGWAAAIDQWNGAVAHHRLSIPPHFPVPVTWLMPLTDILGSTFCETFQSLVSLPEFEQIRVITIRG